MSVRRTVAQSSAGLLLLAAFAVGPTAVYAAPGGPSDGGGDPPEQTECPPDAIPQAFVSPTSPKVGEMVTITGQCFPERGAIKLDVIGPDNAPTPVDVSTDGFGSVSGTFEPEVGGVHRFIFTYEGSGAQPADGSFTVEGAPPGTGGGGDNGEGEDDGDEGSDEDEGGSGDNPDEGEDSEESGDDEQGGEGSDSGDEGQEQGGDDQNSDDDEVVDGGGSDTGGSGSDDETNQDSVNSDESGNVEGSEEEQQGGDTAASGFPTKPFPGDEEDGETSASSANDSAASGSNAPAQPPVAPGSATNDFPAAQQEATADQKQSAALAVLMTKLFAGGVSTGSVGTTPEQARTVIDPSADASEIEVPAGSDNGGSSDDGSGSESSDGDALAATGSNMLVPAGIAAAAILLGAGLKIHQIRRGL